MPVTGAIILPWYLFIISQGTYGVVCAKGYCVGIWKGNDENSYCLWEPHFVGPTGRTSPAGAAGMIIFSTIDELAETLRLNIEDAARPGPNKLVLIRLRWKCRPVICRPSWILVFNRQLPDVRLRSLTSAIADCLVFKCLLPYLSDVRARHFVSNK